MNTYGHEKQISRTSFCARECDYQGVEGVGIPGYGPSRMSLSAAVGA
jgi:hypothetical protein